MSIVESGGPPSWSPDASETGESTKCPWLGVVEGTTGEKNRETVTASLCLVQVQRLWPSFGATENQINKQFPLQEKIPVRSGKYDINYVWLRDILKFKVFRWTYIAHEIGSVQLLNWVEWMRDKRTLPRLRKCQQRPQVAMIHKMRVFVKWR